MKLIPKRFSRSSSSLSNSNGVEYVHWELRPGGMLVQKRDHSSHSSVGKDIIKLRVSTTSKSQKSHDISIEATSTFGELKMILSLVTNLKPKEQRLLFKGKEREDGDYLHMVGIGYMDKVLLLEDPAITERRNYMPLLPKNHIGIANHLTKPWVY